MDMHINTPGMGEILLEEFMEPNGLSAYMLAKEIHVPVSRIQDILHDRRKITVESCGHVMCLATKKCVNIKLFHS